MLKETPKGKKTQIVNKYETHYQLLPNATPNWVREGTQMVHSWIILANKYSDPIQLFYNEPDASSYLVA